MELPTSTQDLENSTAAVQGGPLAPQASSADAPAVDEQDECATTDDKCAAADRISRRPGGPPPCHSASRWPSPLAGRMRPRPRSLRTRPNPPPRRRWTLTLTLPLPLTLTLALTPTLTPAPSAPSLHPPRPLCTLRVLSAPSASSPHPPRPLCTLRVLSAPSAPSATLTRRAAFWRRCVDCDRPSPSSTPSGSQLGAKDDANLGLWTVEVVPPAGESAPVKGEDP